MLVQELKFFTGTWVLNFTDFREWCPPPPPPPPPQADSWEPSILGSQHFTTLNGIRCYPSSGMGHLGGAGGFTDTPLGHQGMMSG